MATARKTNTKTASKASDGKKSGGRESEGRKSEGRKSEGRKSEGRSKRQSDARKSAAKKPELRSGKPKRRKVSPKVAAAAEAKKAAPKPEPKIEPKKVVAKRDVKAAARASTPKLEEKAPAAARKLVGTAGAQVLGDLGLTNDELFAFLPDEEKWVRGVFWCQLELPLSLEQIGTHFEGRYSVEFGDGLKFPPDGPDDGIPIRTVTLSPKGRYVHYTFYGMRGDEYVSDGSFQLEASFRESGTSWGSNRAVYERFKALELGSLGVTRVNELTE